MDRIPGALGYAAEAMDVTRAELVKLVEQGKVDAAEFLPNFINVLKEKTEAGLPEALNKTFTAAGRLKNAFQSFVDVLFRSGIDELFGTILNILTDLFTIAKPFVALFGSALFTVLRNILFIFELIFAAIADAVKWFDYFIRKVTGKGVTDWLMLIGEMLGHIITMWQGAIANAIRGIGKLIRHLNTVKGIFGYFRDVWKSIVGYIARAIKMLPGLGKAAQGTTGAGKAIMTAGGKMTPEAVGHMARGSATINAANRFLDFKIDMSEDAKQMIDVRVEGMTSGKIDHDARE